MNCDVTFRATRLFILVPNPPPAQIIAKSGSFIRFFGNSGPAWLMRKLRGRSSTRRAYYPPPPRSARQPAWKGGERERESESVYHDRMRERGSLLQLLRLQQHRGSYNENYRTPKSACSLSYKSRNDYPSPYLQQNRNNKPNARQLTERTFVET